MTYRRWFCAKNFFRKNFIWRHNDVIKNVYFLLKCSVKSVKHAFLTAILALLYEINMYFLNFYRLENEMKLMLKKKKILKCFEFDLLFFKKFFYDFFFFSIFFKTWVTLHECSRKLWKIIKFCFLHIVYDILEMVLREKIFFENGVFNKKSGGAAIQPLRFCIWYRLKLTCEQNRQRSGCFFGKCFITEFPGIRESRRQISRDSKYPENCHFPGNFPSREFPWESLLMTLRKIGQWHWNSGYRQRKSITLISVPRPSETM